MGRKTIVLGINAWHGDAAAALLVDGELVAAAEEERFRRIKHWAGFPSEAARWCLAEAGVTAAQIDHVAINRDPKARRLAKAWWVLRARPSLGTLADRLRNRARLMSLRGATAQALGVSPAELGASFHPIEHHLAHLASAYLVSPFERAAVVSVDGFGDFSSAQWALGEGRDLRVLGRVGFPHSLGLLYTALTQHLGFAHYGDEYKVMGLAAYGRPSHLPEMRRLVRLRADGGFELDTHYFRHARGGVAMTWEGGAPTLEDVFSPALCELLGPRRGLGEPLEQHHRDLAASAQALYEECLFHLLGRLAERTGETRLAIAGGCGMNSLANGRIAQNTPFRDVWVQPAAGDSGGALGAAFAVWNLVLGRPRSFVMRHAYWGPRADSAELTALLEGRSGELAEAGCRRIVPESEDSLVERVAEALADGKVVGWFQGRMEWGPRALGNRSILGDPRRADMQEILNLKIKRRESFRPFAPSVLAERQGEWFESDQAVPFMGQVFPIRAHQQARIPAVTHADGTGRLQTVERDANPRYWKLIRAFEERTGVPMVLNTSFNENEPVVCRPKEALDCFLRTKMDLLVLGDVLLERLPVGVSPGLDPDGVPAALPAGGRARQEDASAHSDTQRARRTSSR
jgi:carbamoyltransferase